MNRGGCGCIGFDLRLRGAISPELGICKLVSVLLRGLASKSDVALDRKEFKLVHDKLRRCGTK